MRRPAQRRDISEAEIQRRRITEVHVSPPLRLVLLDGPGLNRAGVDASAISGPDYTLSRTVSRHLWRRADQPDGILYPARHDNHLYAAAVFDRSPAAFRTGTPHVIEDDLLRRLLARYRFRLI